MTESGLREYVESMLLSFYLETESVYLSPCGILLPELFFHDLILNDGITEPWHIPLEKYCYQCKKCEVQLLVYITNKLLLWPNIL